MALSLGEGYICEADGMGLVAIKTLEGFMGLILNDGHGFRHWTCKAERDDDAKAEVAASACITSHPTWHVFDGSRLYQAVSQFDRVVDEGLKAANIRLDSSPPS